MKIGYVRASKKYQNPELQRRDLLAFGCEKVFEEQVSSRKEDRPELRAAMDYCRELPVAAAARTATSGRGRRTNVRICQTCAVEHAEAVELCPI